MSRIGIIGSGAMAQLFAARLSAVCDVVLVGSHVPNMDAIAQGITLIHANGQQSTHRVTSGSNPEMLPSCSHILVLTKSHQTAEAAQRAAKLLARSDPNAAVLTLQNGMGNLEVLQEVIGKEYVLAGITTQAARLEAPGKVRDTGPGSISLPSLAVEPGVSSFLQSFSEASFELRQAPSIDQLLWNKLLINAVINPLTAIYQQANGFLLENDKALREAKAIIAEFVKIAGKAGFHYEAPACLSQVLEVAKATAANHSSMLADVQHGRKTEVDAILGYLLRRASEAGLEAPAIQYFYQRILAAGS